MTQPYCNRFQQPFSEHMLKAFPFKVECVQTDNGVEFTKRFLKNDSLSTIEVYPTNEMYLRDSYVGKCRFEKDEPFDAEL